MTHLAFLHTAAQHVATFEALVAQGSPGLIVRHHVAPDLLRLAEATGDSPALHEALRRSLGGIGAAGARHIVCTCSTLGRTAEEIGEAIGLSVVRIDRAMAEAAVAISDNLLVVACLAATVAPTETLLRSVSPHRPLNLRSLVLAEAWGRFRAGDQEGYRDALAAGVRAAYAGEGAVVLAQASMAAAAPLLADLGVPVLSSPARGVAAALAAVGAPSSACA
ncbi:MAG: hypothetical protein J0H82_33830 [Alphaproteobacteria bacterium]|jgi:hypothetical protein|nr:hypothetical protein [Alphaproteobacteria bacterium]